MELTSFPGLCFFRERRIDWQISPRPVLGDTVYIVIEQAAAGCGSGFGALVPNPATVAAIEAARRGEVVELGSPEEAIAELNRDDD